MEDQKDNSQEHIENVEDHDVQHDEDGVENSTNPFAQGDVSIDDILKNQVKKPDDELAIKKRKNIILYGSIGGIVLLFVLFIFSGGNPKGPVEYGLCSTFLEMNTPYPHTLNYYGVEGSKTSIRIYYSSIDPFGQYKSEMIDCKFKTGRGELAEVFVNRRSFDKKEIQKFNTIVPVLLTTDLYLDLPPKWKNKNIR